MNGTRRMHVVEPGDADFSEAWIEGDEGARWVSAPGHGGGTEAEASGSSLLRVEPGCRLPRHTDSAEETIVVESGKATVAIPGDERQLSPGAIAVIPRSVPHEVRNTGDEVLRFAAVYGDPEVTTTYEADVQPDGERTRRPVP
jgi:quercetin dioxygenase-like cupin family protein